MEFNENNIEPGFAGDILDTIPTIDKPIVGDSCTSCGCDIHPDDGDNMETRECAECEIEIREMREMLADMED